MKIKKPSSGVIISQHSFTIFLDMTNNVHKTKAVVKVVHVLEVNINAFMKCNDIVVLRHVQ